jgi:DNA transformation protein
MCDTTAMPQSDSQTVQYLLELMRPLGDVKARRMFGGYGIYMGDLMFGLVADDVLYLKTDANNRKLFDAAAMPPFVYQAKGKPMAMNYSRCPDEALESVSEMRVWAEIAISAALRARSRAPNRSRTNQPGAAKPRATRLAKRAKRVPES